MSFRRILIHLNTLVVWRLDRLGRSLKHLIEVVENLEEKKIGFKSLQESIDTTTSGGRLVFHIFGALAEFERHLIRERKRLLSTNSEYKECRGMSGQYYLDKARNIFQEMGLQYDLDELDKITDRT
ncbi:MAG: recombinase family protein [Deltaproteobacteria bacterium]|nr:recombinase family protein [Deltaproteobacteria bacterium]